MSERVDPSVMQTGYLHYINKKLAEILRILSMNVSYGRAARFKFNINGRVVISMSELIGSDANSVTIKNSGGNPLYVGININAADFEIKPGEAIPFSFGQKVIKYITIVSDGTTAEVIVVW